MSAQPIGWNLDNISIPSKSKKKSKKHKDKKSKSRASSSSSSDSSSSSSSSSNDGRSKPGKKQKLFDGKIKKHKKVKKNKKKDKRDGSPDFGVPINLMQNRGTAPETQESWLARQSVLRRVIDPTTGRERYTYTHECCLVDPE